MQSKWNRIFLNSRVASARIFFGICRNRVQSPVIVMDYRSFQVWSQCWCRCGSGWKGKRKTRHYVVDRFGSRYSGWVFHSQCLVWVWVFPQCPFLVLSLFLACAEIVLMHSTSTTNTAYIVYFLVCLALASRPKPSFRVSAPPPLLTHFIAL